MDEVFFFIKSGLKNKNDEKNQKNHTDCFDYVDSIFHSYKFAPQAKQKN